MALHVLRVIEGRDVGRIDGLHQPAADVRLPGALPDGPPETRARADPRDRSEEASQRVYRDIGQVRIVPDRLDRIGKTRQERGAHMLYHAAELGEGTSTYGDGRG